MGYRAHVPTSLPDRVDRAVTRGLESLFRLGRDLPLLDPLHRWLKEARQKESAARIEAHRAEVADLTESVLAQDKNAIEAYDACAARAIAALRALAPPGAAGRAAWLDRRLYQDDREFLDNPNYPEAQRLRIVQALDGLNEHLGSYARWLGLITPYLERANAHGQGPLVIHDLAAGHGGFAIFLKEKLGERALITASDRMPSYLELGRARAAERGLDVGFIAQDATDLGNLPGPPVDLFLCTQSLHHFPPGMVGRILGQAARAARAGVIFIDGERSYLSLLALSPLMLLYGRSWATGHDTAVSVRRMFVLEELELLARLAPGLPAHARVQAARLAPGYAYIAIETA